MFTLRSQTLRLAILLALALPIVASCGGGSTQSQPSSTVTTWTIKVGAENADHSIQLLGFFPKEITLHVGDSVEWDAGGAEIHNVIFLRTNQQEPQFSPSDPMQTMPQGNSVYDGHSYHGSGLLSTIGASCLPNYKSYKLTLPQVGTFTYHCTIHPGMDGVLHVVSATTPLPHNQNDYNQMAQAAISTALPTGNDLIAQAQKKASDHNVIVGTGGVTKDGVMVMVSVFFPKTITIPVGDRVTFTNDDPMQPHTVTIGSVPPSQEEMPVGNPANFNGTAPLSSGFMGAHWRTAPYVVTFTKQGTYTLICLLHAYYGMTGRVVVQ